MTSVLEATPPSFSADDVARIAAELFGLDGTVTDLGRELHVAYNDLNAAPWLRSKSRKFHHRAWNRIDRAVRSLSMMA